MPVRELDERMTADELLYWGYYMALRPPGRFWNTLLLIQAVQAMLGAKQGVDPDDAMASFEDAYRAAVGESKSQPEQMARMLLSLVEQLEERGEKKAAQLVRERLELVLDDGGR